MLSPTIAARRAGIHTAAVATRRVPITVTAAIDTPRTSSSAAAIRLCTASSRWLVDSTGWCSIADLYCTAGKWLVHDAEVSQPQEVQHVIPADVLDFAYPLICIYSIPPRRHLLTASEYRATMPRKIRCRRGHAPASGTRREGALPACGLSGERGMTRLRLRFPPPVPIAPGRCGWR